MATINIEVLHIWDLGTTGLVGNMTATLERFPSGTSQVSATETVALAEIGSTGVYTATYTPENAQVYVLSISESTTFQETRYEDTVSDAPSTASANNAYCTEADVVAVVQFASDFTASTVPTETQVLGFMEQRAGEIYAVLVRVMGSSAPGPSGYSTTIDTTTDTGLALSKVCKLANSLGAGADALQAGGAGETPGFSERITNLYEAYREVLGGIGNLARAYLGYGTVARNHYTEGRVSKATFTSRTEPGFVVDDSTTW